MLAVEYAPQNFYCYAIDAKAPDLFRKRIHAMASCFPNVFVAPQEFDVQSNGKNVSRSHLACLRELGGIDKKKEDGGIRWKYAILLQVNPNENEKKIKRNYRKKKLIFLQNQDIPLRTNAEMVEMLTVYNGTNEVGTLRITKVVLKIRLLLGGIQLNNNVFRGLGAFAIIQVRERDLKRIRNDFPEFSFHYQND